MFSIIRGGLADCGNSLPPQDAAIGNPENPRRFAGVAEVEKALGGFFHGQLVIGRCPRLHKSLEGASQFFCPAAKFPSAMKPIYCSVEPLDDVGGEVNC